MTTSPPTSQIDFVTAACAALEADDAPDLGALAVAAGYSRFHFHRVFKAATGVTPKAWAQAARAKRVREALVVGGTVTSAIYEAGYNSSGRFYEQSTAMLGMKPEAFKNGGVGEVICFAVAQSSLGAVLVASSTVGVCAITLGDDPQALVVDLQDRFPKATLVGADDGYEGVVAAVVGFIEAPGIGLSLPLDVRGTAFQQRVWSALREVPSGTTISYAQLAAKIGAPTSSRAVAQACGANAIAVAVPCHRVVRADGGLSGYRWGVDRKQALLVREGAR